MLRIALSVLFILALMGGTGVTLAVPPDHMGCHDDVHIVTDEDSGIPVPLFTDCRLNAADQGAPVVVYYTYDVKPVLDSAGNQVWGPKGGLFFEDVITGIDVNMIDLETGLINNALHVDVADITAALAEQGTTDFEVATNGPVSLNYSQSGWFWIEALDREGKPYTFQWEGFGLQPR